MSSPFRQPIGLSRFQSWAQKYGARITLVGGSLIIVMWTVIRHITNGVNFDVVGQIGVVEQWSHGLTGGAQVGSTNYLFKMPAYWLVNQLGFLSPHAKLLGLALLFNLLTFILLFGLFQKILELLGVRSRSWLYLSLAWLATISGRLYWLDYANSRNLETVGGIFFVYLSIKFIKYHTWPNAGWLLLIGSIVFFADPLQFFVIALPICLYTVWGWLRSRTRDHFALAAYLIGLSGLSYAVSQLIFRVASALLPVAFLAIPKPTPSLTGQLVWQSVRQSLVSTLKNFDADFFRLPVSPNSIREFLNALVLAAIIILLIKLVISKPPRAFPRGLVLTIILINYVVYVASGQALQWETARYLVMVPLISLLAVAIWGDTIVGKRKQIVQLVWAAVIVISCVLLLGALAVNWPNRYAKDAYINDTLSYLQQHHYEYAVSSRAVAIPGTYFAGGSRTILPVICSSNHQVHRTNLFYDTAAFRGLPVYHGDVPFILMPGDSLRGDLHCNKADVIAQFGSPKREELVPGVGTAEIYDATVLRLND